MRLIPYVLYLILLAAYQVIFRDLVTIYGFTVNMAGFMVITVALYKPELAAVWFGFVAGIVVGAGEPSLMGWYALITAALGAVAFHFRERLNVESFVSKVLLVFAGTLGYNLVLLFVSQREGFFYLLGTNAIPGAVYTTIVAWVFFLFKEGRFTAAKLKSMF